MKILSSAAIASVAEWQAVTVFPIIVTYNGVFISMIPVPRVPLFLRIALRF